MSRIGTNLHHHYFDVKNLHWDMNFFPSKEICLGFLLTLTFLTLSVWNRIFRSRAPKDCDYLYQQSFYWLCAMVVLYLILLLLALDLPEFIRTQKEKFWPAPEEPGYWSRLWQKIKDAFDPIKDSPRSWGYWFCTQIPPNLIRWYLARPNILSLTEIKRNVWIFFFIPVLIPPIILNYEIMVTGTVKYFYASLVLTLIPVVARLLLSTKKNLGLALTVQAFRRDHKISYLDSETCFDSKIQASLVLYLVSVLELIPWDLQKSFLDQWKLGLRIQTQVASWEIYRKNPGWKIRVLRFSLLMLGWGGIIIQGQLGLL